MASRALIIAIENYSRVTGGGLAKTLPGTLDAALRFRDWLNTKWQAEGKAAADTQLLLCSEPPQPGGGGASRDDIVEAMLKLKQDGQSATDELYVFFSGHGFVFMEKPDSRANVIVCANFKSADLSGNECLNLDQMIVWLRDHLGPGKHYYFVDACRNRLDPSKIQVGAGPPYDPQASAEATTYLLQSTAEGNVATVGTAFPKALLAGLKGQGRAKTWDDTVHDAMLVRYDSLRSYLKALLTKQPIASRVEGPDGEKDGVLAILKPVPASTCTIVIDEAPSVLRGRYSLRRGRGDAGTPQDLQGSTTVVTLEPDTYSISVQLTEPPVGNLAAQTCDLYEDREVVFSAAIEGTDGEDTEGLETVVLAAPMELRPADWQQSPPHAAIASLLPQTGGGVDFSGLLGGAITDPDLDLWLALLGGGRVLGYRGDYSKLAHFPLHDFSQAPPGASPIYVLAGFADPATPLRVGLTRDATVAWNIAIEPPGMPGIREAVLPAASGPSLVSFSIGSDAPYTVATFATPNRAMLITLTVDDDGNPRLAQYLLPLGHLIESLEPEIRSMVQSRNHLSDVCFLAQASRAFRRRRDVGRELGLREDRVFGQHELDQLLYSKWLDPIASSLAAYEQLRRGRKQLLEAAIGNMKRFFRDLPDTAALAKLCGDAVAAPNGTPLFSDGLKAFPPEQFPLPLPSSQLDYTSSWTAWRAAVH